MTGHTRHKPPQPRRAPKSAHRYNPLPPEGSAAYRHADLIAVGCLAGLILAGVIGAGLNGW